MIRARPEETARVYLAALLAGDSPVRAVAEHYGITDPAARQRVSRARAKGIDLPDPRSRGRQTALVLKRGESGEWSLHPEPAEAHSAMTHEERAVIAKVFEESRECQMCGGWHPFACPRVKSIEWETDGGTRVVKRAEFWPHGAWPTGEVIWRADVEIEDD